MRNLLKVSFLALVIAGGVACKKDEEKNDPKAQKEKAVEGDWKMTDQEQDGSTSYGGQVISTQTGKGSNFDGLLRLKADKTFESDLSYDATIITSTMGMTDTITMELSGFSSSGTWSINEDGNLQAKSDGDAQEIVIFVITELTANEMVLDYSSTQKVTQGSISASTEVNTTITLEKQ